MRFSLIAPKSTLRFLAYAEGDPNPAGEPNPTGDPNPAGDPAPKMLSQDQVNAILAREKRAWEQKTQLMIQQLEQLKQAKGLTEQEKQDLQTRIEELQASFQTKEQQQQTELAKLQKKYDKDISEANKTGETWRNNHDNLLKKVDIGRAASKFKAINSSQIEAILLPITKVTEKLDDEGKPSGEWVTKVNFPGKDKEGKAVQLTLSVEEAVKMMTEMPEEYGNLFQNQANGGVGVNPSSGQSKGILGNIQTMTVEEYKAARPQLQKAAGR